MRTALDKLQEIIELERADIDHYYIEVFTFRYKNIYVEFLGHYWIWLYEDGKEGEDEYCWESYEEMLDDMIFQTGKTMRQMLSELDEIDLAVDYH